MHPNHVLGRIDGNSFGESVPRRVRAHATAQFGVVARKELILAKVPEEVIDKWLQAGRLSLLFRGVYSYGHAALRREGWFVAAVLAAGKGSVLSHRSAAFHWGLLDERGDLIDVTTPRRSQDGLAGIRLHRPRSLDALDVTRHRGIPATTVARTLVDLAHGEPEWVVRRAWDQAEMANRLDPLEVAEAVERAGRRRGIRKVKRLLFLTRPEGIGRTKSGFEIDFLRLLGSTDLPKPLVNEKVCGWEADFQWPEGCVIVETDGGRYHSTALRRLRDEERDRVHRRAGYRVLRISDTEFNASPADAIARVREALNARCGTD